MDNLPWSEDYMLRHSYPAYDAWESEDENNYDREAEAEALADLRKEDYV